jgi:hypothetical protein
MNKTIGATLGVALAVVVACGDDDDINDQEETDDTNQVGDWTEEDVEYQLTVIDLGRQPGEDDIELIESYANSLDAAEAVCEQDRTMLSDMAVSAWQTLEEEGRPQPLSELVDAYAEAVPDERAPMDCAEVLAGVMALID